jgi:hypothetical protein
VTSAPSAERRADELGVPGGGSQPTSVEKPVKSPAVNSCTAETEPGALTSKKYSKERALGPNGLPSRPRTTFST